MLSSLNEHTDEHLSCYNTTVMLRTQRRMDTDWYRTRWEILLRDDFTCQYCGQFAPNVKLEVDHKIAIVDGGTDELDNLVTACWSCNRGKEGYRAHIQPRRPSQLRPSLPRITLTSRLAALELEHPEFSLKNLASTLEADIDVVRTLRRRLFLRRKKP